MTTPYAAGAVMQELVRRVLQQLREPTLPAPQDELRRQRDPHTVHGRGSTGEFWPSR
jgi:hypothetical protein